MLSYLRCPKMIWSAASRRTSVRMDVPESIDGSVHEDSVPEIMDAGSRLYCVKVARVG